jgi:hypothetical protein
MPPAGDGIIFYPPLTPPGRGILSRASQEQAMRNFYPDKSFSYSPPGRGEGWVITIRIIISGQVMLLLMLINFYTTPL